MRACGHHENRSGCGRQHGVLIGARQSGIGVLGFQVGSAEPVPFGESLARKLRDCPPISVVSTGIDGARGIEREVVNVVVG